MDSATVKAIAEQWMIPTPGGAYMAGLEKRPVIERAEGAYVYDTTGKRYLDYGSGQMAASLGHNHPRFVASVQRSLTTISHASKTFLNVDRLTLHRRLGEILTKPLQQSLFLVSGSDAIEAAVDLARKATGGVDVIGLSMALHGSTSFVTRSLTFGWNRRRHQLAAPGTSAILAPYSYRSPVGDDPELFMKWLEASLELAEVNFTGRPAAAIMEPVMSAGGIIVPPAGFVKMLRDFCHARGMLLIMDESQTGLGKTGKMWAHEHDGVVPDIMTVSKHFGAGLPVSAVCTTPEIASRAVENGYFATRSHACDPILCAAGVASIDIIKEENLVERAAAIGERQKTTLNEMANDIDLIGEIRGRGVLYGVELVLDRDTRAPANPETQEVVKVCQDKGLIVQARGAHGRMNVVRLVPPMICTDSQIDEGLSILYDALREVSRNRRTDRTLEVAE